MSTDRLDELLERAASGAELPTDMTQAERAQLESLVAGAGSLRTTAGVVEDEAAASLPAARARFERFMAAREGETTVAPAPRGWFRRVPRRGVMLIGAAAAIGVIAAGGVFAFQAAFSTTSSADAEVLAPNDYAQVQGVVTGIEHADATTTLHVESAFGVVNVTVGPATAVERDTAATSPAAISAGELVSVSGVAGTARTLTADAVAIESAGGSQLVSAPVSQLRRLGTPLEGKIVAFAVSPEGTQARVLVRTGGKYYVVPLEGAAVARLLTRSANALGTDASCWTTAALQRSAASRSPARRRASARSSGESTVRTPGKTGRAMRMGPVYYTGFAEEPAPSWGPRKAQSSSSLWRVWGSERRSMNERIPSAAS
ncbi:hypothetical protein J0H33_13330, partial [bacterium]|nr:hypothetical protein [bacterium]